MPLSERSKPKLVMGLMSGTSVDGVDACAARMWMDGEQFHYEMVGTYSHPIPEVLRERLLLCMRNEPVLLEELCRLNTEVGLLFAEAALGLLAASGVSPKAVDCIGSHGQTLYHLPPVSGELGSTLQIGEPAIIAEKTGILTIADFRPSDMAAGGQGAPLVCFADQWLFQRPDEGRCVQNIGGIGNVTVLPPKGQGDVRAFDTGPGNMLIDGAVERLYQQPYDAEGKIASSGHVNRDLLGWLLGHPYLKQAPPKTTGREAFGQVYLNEALSRFSHLSSPDLIATFTFYTAQTIADAYQRFVFPDTQIGEVIIGGGGAYNTTLMQMLDQLLKTQCPDIQLKTHQDYGLNNKYKEALAFAMLAWAHLHQMPNNIPSCTGATHPVIMGKQVLPGG